MKLASNEAAVRTMATAASVGTSQGVDAEEQVLHECGGGD